MDLTFDLFKQKYTNLLEKNEFWSLTINNENEYKVRNETGKTLSFNRCDAVTNDLNNNLNRSCLVYEKAVVYKDGKDEKLFEVVGYFQETLVIGEITVEKNGEPCKPHTTWFKLDEDWYKYGQLSKTEHLEEFESFFIEHILELPAYRLYNVTGMLEG